MLDTGEGDEKGDPWPFICASRASIGIGDGGGKWKRRDALRGVLMCQAMSISANFIQFITSAPQGTAPPHSLSYMKKQKR